MTLTDRCNAGKTVAKMHDAEAFGVTYHPQALHDFYKVVCDMKDMTLGAIDADQRLADSLALESA